MVDNLDEPLVSWSSVVLSGEQASWCVSTDLANFGPKLPIQERYFNKQMFWLWEYEALQSNICVWQISVKIREIKYVCSK